MLFTTIAHDYFRWHYTRAFGELFHVWLNFLWFIINFFSIPQLTTSLFAPWKRMTETRHRRWSLEDMAGFVIINLLSRLIGACFRGTIIVIGLAALGMTTAMGFVTFVFWVIAPLVILLLAALGITMFAINLV